MRVMTSGLLEAGAAALMVRDDGEVVLVLREGLLPEEDVRHLDRLLSPVGVAAQPPAEKDTGGAVA